MLLAAIAGAAGVAGLAAADDHTDVSPDDPEPGVATNHTWITHVDDGVDNQTEQVTLNYHKTGADLRSATVSDVNVWFNGTSVNVSSVATDGETTEVLHVYLKNESAAYTDGGEELLVSLAGDAVDNPPSSDAYTVQIGTRNDGYLFYSDHAGLSIYETGSIDGTITDEAGNAIENATVEFYTDEFSWYDRVETAGDGSYALSDVPAADEYHVWANKDSYTENTTRIGVQADATTQLDLSLVDAGTIEGQVIDSESNDGVSGIDVTVLENGTDTRAASATTDDAGNYSFDLEPGNYDVVVTSLTYANNQATNVSIDVDETAVEDVYVAPHDTGTIDGTVTDVDDNSLENGFVEVFTRDGHHVTTALVDGNDAYSKELPTGNYDLLAHTGSETYSEEWLRNVSVDDNATTTNDFVLREQAVVSGQVTDQNGDPVRNVDVGVLDDGAWVDGARTDDTGHYSVGVPAGTYQLSVRAGGYEELHTDDVTLSTSSSTTMDLDVVEQATGTLAGTVTDANGTQIEGARVNAFRNHDWVNGTTTGSSGDYSLGLPTGTYTIEVVTDAHGRQRFEDVEITEGQETPLNPDLIEPAVVSGEVDNGSAVNASNGVLIADGPVREFAPVRDGSYQLHLPPGEYSLTVFTENREISTSSASIDVESNDTVTEHFDVIQPTISDEQIRQIDDGPSVDEENLSVSAMLGPGVMLVRAFDERNPPNADAPAELEQLGVTETTEFEIEFTVEGYDPETLLWGARDVDWSVEENEDGSHNVTISTKPVHLSAIDPMQNPMGPLQGTDYREIDWPTGENDTADVGFNQTVYFGLFDGSTLPDSALGEFQGMTITTNAQAFSRPRFVDDSLEVYVAGPSTTVAGNQHEGFYDAFIPQSQLDAWGVDDPATDLQALYKGESSDFAVTKEEDGAWIHLDITYSDGVVEVSPAAEEDGDDGGGGGLFLPPSDGDDTDESDDSGDEETDGTDDTADDDTDEGDTESETDDDEPDRQEDQNDDAEDDPESDETPGFGLGIAVLALLAALGLRVRREP